MSIKVPKYFTRFRCIAKKCRDNCCIGWKIRIDDELMEKYKKLSNDLGRRLERGIESDGESHYFTLGAGGRCPFLNAEGLCDIIIEMGDGYLCEICREHPRYYNVFAGYCEGGIGMSCEVGASLVIDSENDEFIEIDGDFADCDEEYDAAALADTIAVRDTLLSLAGDGQNWCEEELLHTAAELDQAHGFGDDRCDAIDTNEAIEAAMTLIPFNAQFTEDLTNARAIAGNVTGFITGAGRVYSLRLLRYFIRRHFINSVYMLNPLATMRMCLASVKVIAAMYLARGGSEAVCDTSLLAECAKDYSKSVEYNTDNTDDLIDMA